MGILFLPFLAFKFPARYHACVMVLCDVTALSEIKIWCLQKKIAVAPTLLGQNMRKEARIYLQIHAILNSEDI